MPKETFFNLSEKKRGTIINAALQEFGQNNYDKASLNRIVAASGISKGSLYQYFDDKRDLFMYLIDLMIREKLGYITPVMRNPMEHSFFDVIHDMNQEGLRFAIEHPEYTAIGKRIISDESGALYQDIMNRKRALPAQVYENLLQLAISRGEIREDIDISFTAHMIFAMSVEITTSCLTGSGDNWISDTAKLLDQFMNLLFRGIQKNKGGAV